MKRLQWITVLSAAAVVVPALALEKYDASVVARGNNGNDFTYRFTLEIDRLEPGAIGGQISSWDSKICGSGRAIKGNLKPSGQVKFATEESPIRGCGKLDFTGRRKDDASIVGKMKFQGELHEFVFKKQ